MHFTSFGAGGECGAAGGPPPLVSAEFPAQGATPLPPTLPCHEQVPTPLLDVGAARMEAMLRALLHRGYHVTLQSRVPQDEAVLQQVGWGGPSAGGG